MDAALTPTKERIKHAADRYQPPELSQTVNRPYARLRPWYEALALPGPRGVPVIDTEQAQAARDLDIFWHSVHAVRGVTGAYGDQRWSGTPIAQLDMQRLNSEEYRETARRKLRACCEAVDNPRQWLAICHMIETDCSLEHVGWFLGAASERTAQRWGGMTVQEATTKLARHLGYRTPYP